jgi:phage gp36-like protein
MYETVDNIRARLPKITDEIRDDAFVQSCITEAMAEVDAYLSRRYSTPLEEPPDPIITYITSSLAQSLLLESVYSSETPFIGDLVGSLRERAEFLLVMIAKGKINLKDAEIIQSTGAEITREELSDTLTENSEFSVPDEVLRGGGGR